VVSVAQNLAQVRSRIATACAAAGRGADEVRLLPVSKTVGSQAIREAYAAGVRMLGENRVHEALPKAEELADTDLTWSIIGHLQTNKAPQVARFAAELQTLDSLRLAEQLDRRLQQAGRSLDVFVQVNSSGEDRKSGLPPDEVEAFTQRLGQFTSLNVRGLMTVAIFSNDQAQVVECFARMTAVRARLQDRDGAGWSELSMGMSGDFELAIGHGATVVRVGQAIFGSRV